MRILGRIVGVQSTEQSVGIKVGDFCFRHHKTNTKGQKVTAMTKSSIINDLKSMGLTGSETILIHSSMKAVGNVEGGADTVLDALMEFFADGLLLLPTHTWKTVNESNPVFDLMQHPMHSGRLL